MKTIFKYILVCIPLVFLSACSSSKESVKTTEPIIYPAPPDKPRIQYLTSFSKSTDITGEQSSFLSSVVGKEEVRQIVKPYGISIYKGKIYVCDTILGELIIINLNNSTFEDFSPKGLGQLKKPINCFNDAEGRLYVTDTKRQQVVIFDKNGKYITSFGEKEKIKPIDVFVDNKNIWVSDLHNHSVMVYDKKTYKFMYSIPKANADSSAKLYSPTNLAMSKNNLYVSDFGGFDIKVYSKDGKYKRTIGSYGRNLGQFVRQKGIAVDKDENLYVVDAGFENVQIFNKEGNLLMFFGGPYKGPGDMWLPAKIIIDYDNLKYFQKYVYNKFKLKYLIFVTNQYGPEKINVYGFIEEK